MRACSLTREIQASLDSADSSRLISRVEGSPQIGHSGKDNKLSKYSEIVSDLLQARRAEPSATAMFRNLKHDKDLCPSLRDKVDEIFSA